MLIFRIQFENFIEYLNKQDGKAVIMAEVACMATLTDLMVTSDQATNSSMPTIQFNSFLILIW